MHTASRANHILSVVDKVGRVSVVELARELNVSPETIRRDLKVLDSKGEVTRIHGGAVMKSYRDEGISFNERVNHNIDDKRILVKEVISHIFKGAAIGLDASSTSWLVAQALPNIHCTVVTNSINNINILSGKHNVNVICIGGRLSEKYKAFYGTIARNTLSEMALDFCVISCVGFDEHSGVWDSNEYNYEIKREFIQVSDKVILLADKSKYKKKSLLRICGLDEVDILVSNAELSL
ncbi:DeoR/GlpR transcriptional regulator [Vibrio mimicus]|uniref:DeoR/GlpR family DNA-binding transcription regulator n=1 Tax=Vibrio mimicus TaxID=674 RepID=UPI0011D80717|nr:DeoR/GlpR family DNA-binding transcription regulator [Vibrio mimicus]TXZ07902.1 DeoR/GlpR transcriptional regulator [Vibrio mimicus]